VAAVEVLAAGRGEEKVVARATVEEQAAVMAGGTGEAGQEAAEAAVLAGMVPATAAAVGTAAQMVKVETAAGSAPGCLGAEGSGARAMAADTEV
jgi:hypothetical protein